MRTKIEVKSELESLIKFCKKNHKKMACHSVCPGYDAKFNGLEAELEEIVNFERKTRNI